MNPAQERSLFTPCCGHTQVCREWQFFLILRRDSGLLNSLEPNAVGETSRVKLLIFKWEVFCPSVYIFRQCIVSMSRPTCLNTWSPAGNATQEATARSALLLWTLSELWDKDHTNSHIPLSLPSCSWHFHSLSLLPISYSMNTYKLLCLYKA